MFRRFRKEKQIIFVPPFDDLDVMAGQGTIGLEIYEDLKDVQTVVVSVGGVDYVQESLLQLKPLHPNAESLR